jgi:endo-1,3(4)-beta-glucanase
MIPINPISAYIRTRNFVSEEWATYFANMDVDDMQDGWRGILMANLAIAEPEISWAFFSDPNFNFATLDGGASLTWYLTYVAGLGVV